MAQNQIKVRKAAPVKDSLAIPTMSCGDIYGDEGWENVVIMDTQNIYIPPEFETLGTNRKKTPKLYSLDNLPESLANYYKRQAASIGACVVALFPGSKVTPRGTYYGVFVKYHGIPKAD